MLCRRLCKPMPRIFFFFNDTATTEIYTLSLHDALPFFGRVYVCWASFRSQELGRALPTPLTVARSADGGETWTVSQVGPATNNGIQGQPDGCVVRTDSQGNAYVFGVGLRNGVRLQMMY